MTSYTKYCRHLLLFAFLFFNIAIVCAQTKPLRIFIIGNSFSGNATTYLWQLVKEGGYQVQVGRAELGGCSLQTHWELAAVAKANPEDPKGKAYKGKSLKELLSDGKWDVVTLQQYSLLSADIKTYQPYADSLYQLIKSIQPDAKVVFHQTWAYRSDAKSFGYINGKERAKDDKQMYDNLAANYKTMAQKLHAGLIPSGAAFWKMRNNPEWSFVPDDKATAEVSVYPGLPAQLHSLNVGYKWEPDHKLKFDPNHANDAGCYLGGLVWYHYFFNADLTKVKFKPTGVDEEFAKQLRMAANAVFNDNSAILIK